MRTITLSIAFVLTAGAGFAQTWEFGGSGGASFLNRVSANGPSGSANAGFAPGVTFGAYLGQNLFRHIGGEIHYEFMQSNLRLSSGGQSVDFSGQSHALHYDVVYHTNNDNSPVQFFGAVGGGMKIFRATGAEQAYQPLSQFGYFTKGQTLKPMLSVGGGVKYKLRPHLYLRAEIRDMITGFPTEVITPAPGVKFGSLLHDIVPMVGITYAY